MISQIYFKLPIVFLKSFSERTEAKLRAVLSSPHQFLLSYLFLSLDLAPFYFSVSSTQLLLQFFPPIPKPGETPWQHVLLPCESISLQCIQKRIGSPIIEMQMSPTPGKATSNHCTDPARQYLHGPSTLSIYPPTQECLTCWPNSQ